MCILQLNTKKRFVLAAIAFIWVVIPAIEIAFSVVTTDIVKGTCIAFGVYSSYAMKQSTTAAAAAAAAAAAVVVVVVVDRLSPVAM